MQGAESYPRTAYLLSLVGGILVLFLSIILAILYAVLASVSLSFGFGFAAGIAIGLAVLALLMGVLILVFALRMKNHPESAQMAGVVVLICAIISFVGGGGFYIGAILAIVGGILALIWKRPAATTSAPSA